MPYNVKLESFEGPLDLLLFLIKKNEVDIYDIPISKITRQYLDYIEIIKLLDIEAAGDFILMAATLMRIKAQMLLPKPDVDELEEVEDPRQELVYRLLEYKRFKDVAIDLAHKEEESGKVFSRGRFKFEREDYVEELIKNSDVTLFDLVAAFKKIIEKTGKISVHHVEELNVTLEDKMQFILGLLAEKKQIEFSKLFKGKNEKIELIVTFIALLELIKQHYIKAQQSEVFGEILIIRIHA